MTPRYVVVWWPISDQTVHVVGPFRRLAVARAMAAKIERHAEDSRAVVHPLIAGPMATLEWIGSEAG